MIGTRWLTYAENPKVTKKNDARSMNFRVTQGGVAFFEFVRKYVARRVVRNARRVYRDPGEKR